MCAQVKVGGGTGGSRTGGRSLASLFPHPPTYLSRCPPAHHAPPHPYVPVIMLPASSSSFFPPLRTSHHAARQVIIRFQGAKDGVGQAAVAA